MGVTLSYASIIEIAMILASAYLSFKTTKRKFAAATILPGMRFRKLPFFSSVSLLR